MGFSRARRLSLQKAGLFTITAGVIGATVVVVVVVDGASLEYLTVVVEGVEGVVDCVSLKERHSLCSCSRNFIFVLSHCLTMSLSVFAKAFKCSPVLEIG